MKISAVTPWAGSTAHLLPAYREAVRGFDEVVLVDNASDTETAKALVAATSTESGWRYARNDNLGFAGGSNVGYRMTTGDAIVFLNSDIAPAEVGNLAEAVRRDLRDGVLLGPSIAQQMIWGMWVPYIDGFCVGATRKTWRRLGEHGPWDAIGYPGPYWEDCDLSFRAMRLGIELAKTDWPIVHLGGQTAGEAWRHGASYERNRAVFAERVKIAWEERVRT